MVIICPPPSDRQRELLVGEAIELDGRTWLVQMIGNDLALLVAWRRRLRERVRPTRYLNGKHGLPADLDWRRAG